MKDLLISYVLCAAGIFSPLAGLHRFYLNKPISAILYLMTWGFFGVGTVIDLIRMPALVDGYNIHRLFIRRIHSELFPRRERLSSPERAILKCANDNGGVITIPMAALASGLDMARAKIELDRLYRAGFCHKDVDVDGSEIFEFKGLKAKKPLI